MDNLENVEDLTSLWNFDESDDDDYLRKQLQYVTDELAEARKEASEQARINKENVKKLIHLLGIAYKERDEAKAQLRDLLMVKPPTLAPSSLPPSRPPPPPPTTTTTTTNVTNYSSLKGNTTLPTKLKQIPLSINPTWDLISSVATTNPTMSPRSPLMTMNNNINLPVTLPNSGMTSHSNTPSSSMDSYSNVGSSPESYNMLSNNPKCACSSYDATCTILDMLAEGRPRPEKGKLLQSVMEAGPLLDSLLVAGSLPKWMNPPQVMHAPQVPPVPFSMCKRPRYNESLDH